MNDKPEDTPGPEGARSLNATQTRRSPKQTRIVVTVAVLAIVAVALVVGLLWWSRNRSGAGRPVPAPRTITADSSASPAQTEPTESDLAKAQSEYLSTLAKLDEHHKHHSRTMKLVEIGAASREELEQATTKLRTAEAAVASQRQRLLLLGVPAQRINQLKSSAQVTSEVSLPAPLSGTIISRTVNPGEVIAADKELLRVSDLSSVWVIAQVYEKDLGKIRIGSGASITSDAYLGRVFRGQVSYIDPVIDQTTRTAQVRLELANPGQLLKIGMFVNVAFATFGGAEATTPVVPKLAVQNVNNQQVVFVAKQPNLFAMQPVRLGLETNGVSRLGGPGCRRPNSYRWEFSASS